MAEDKARSDRPRIDEAAAAGKAPVWLRQALSRIAEHADQIAPLADDRTRLPEFIYRH